MSGAEGAPLHVAFCPLSTALVVSTPVASTVPAVGEPVNVFEASTVPRMMLPPHCEICMYSLGDGAKGGEKEPFGEIGTTI